MTAAEHPITVQLSADEHAALERARIECFPNASLAAMARKLIRDDLVRQGLMPLPRENRSRWAGRK
jgi:hypothetical protein